jgi:hypothetical protein
VIENQKPNGTILMDKSMQKLVYQRLSAKISGKSFWFFWFAVLVMLASVFAAHAQSTSNISQTSSDAVDLQELTRQAVSHYDQRRQQAENYTYLKHGRFKRFDNRGKFHWESTTMEIVFIYGGQDVRMIEYNGRPIPREQQKSEWDRLQEIIDKHLEAAAKLHFQTGTYYYYYEKDVQLPLRQHPSLFDIKLKGHPMLDGRRTYLVEASPKMSYPPADDDEKNAQAFLIKLWIDEKDREISKLEIKLIAEAKLFRTVLIVKAGGSEAQKSAGDPNEVYEPGTILGMEWTKINGEAWLPKSAHSKGKFRFLPARNSFPEEGEATYSDYKKFRVDTKVTPENSN